ncbi:MAG: HAD family hydrolase [Caldilineae bacterium]|nr:MAG: HAD family hydrolase [Caldilineae bacterium]
MPTGPTPTRSTASPETWLSTEMTIQAIIFDFDGTLIDTETPDYRSWQEVFRSHGAELDLATWVQVIGRADGVFDMVEYLRQLVGRPISGDVATRRRQRFYRLVAREPLRPGVAAYLEEAVRMGLRLGVATSSGPDWARQILADRGLLHHFHCIKTAADVAEAKPHPQLYLDACAALGCAPRHAIAIEDSPNGALAALRAGLFTVVVPNPMTANLPFPPVHLRLDSLADLPLSRLVERAAAVAHEPSPPFLRGEA